MQIAEKTSKAIGRIASGLFIVTFHNVEANKPDGMLMSWVQQCSFEPPMLAIAVKKGRFGYEQIKKAGCLVVNVMSKANGAIISKFYKASDDRFAGIETLDSSFPDALIIAEAVANLECKVVSIAESPGCHDLILAEILSGEVRHEELEPSIHLRKNGLDY